jgi:hypothetical protein
MLFRKSYFMLEAVVDAELVAGGVASPDTGCGKSSRRMS